MILISHRGNIDGMIPALENTSRYIQRAIDLGYDVEIDIWVNDGTLYLGHDAPQYPIDIDWLFDHKQSLWVHTKNFAALSSLLSTTLRIFYHREERHTIISNCNLIWSHDLSEANTKSIIPLLSEHDASKYACYTHVHGICSDYVDRIRDNI